MTEELRNELIQAGIDIDGTMDRFMNNEGLFIKFIKKFKNDPTMAALDQALQDKDAEEGFKQAHTLKGVASNFGMHRLLKSLEPMVEILRAGKIDGIDEYWSDVQLQHHLLSEAIDKI